MRTTILLLLCSLGLQAQISFNHVALGVSDLDNSTDFYTRILQIKQIPDPTNNPGIRWFDLGEGKELHLVSTPKNFERAPRQTHFAISTAKFDEFVQRLAALYTGLKPFLRHRAYLTIIVKNVKKGGKIYPLAWDLARVLGQTYTLKDERIWCQDNQRLAPYGMGNAWVSNTFHHYCLQFRNE